MKQAINYHSDLLSKYSDIKRLPKGHRFVKQQGYKRGNFHNWAIYDKDNFIISLGGRTKKEARYGAITKFNPSK